MITRILNGIEYAVTRPFDYILAALLRTIFKDLK
jgi:hypothetical protein